MAIDWDKYIVANGEIVNIKTMKPRHEEITAEEVQQHWDKMCKKEIIENNKHACKYCKDFITNNYCEFYCKKHKRFIRSIETQPEWCKKMSLLNNNKQNKEINEKLDNLTDKIKTINNKHNRTNLLVESIINHLVNKDYNNFEYCPYCGKPLELTVQDNIIYCSYCEKQIPHWLDNIRRI